MAPEQVYPEVGNPYERWKIYYRPPIEFILHLLQIGAIIWCFAIVIAPTIGHLYNIRKMLVTILLPEMGEDEPFTSYSDVASEVEDCLNNLEHLARRSFQKFYFVDERDPVHFVTRYRNGTTVNSSYWTINLDYFEHIEYFELVSRFMFLSETGTLKGCTQWNLQFRVRVMSGSYLFGLEPTLEEGWCPESVMARDDSVLEPQPQSNTFQKIVVNGTLSLRSTSNVRAGGSPYNLFHRNKLSLYQAEVKLGLFLMICSCVHLVILCISFGNRFMIHKTLMMTNAEYSDLDSYEQFHSVIGFWLPLSLVTSFLVFAAACCLAVDANKMTQFPSQRTVVVFGVAALFCIAGGIRWLHFVPNCYSVVIVIRQAFGRLMLVIVGILPVAFGLMFVGLFLFGRVATVSQSMVNLSEIFLSVTFGDMIAGVYQLFTDGSETYNILAFVYVTLMTAVAMWLFFTAFTAQMVLIYQGSVSSLLT